MMISARDWANYANRLARLSDAAAEQALAYIQRHGVSDAGAFYEVAAALAGKYGEGAAAIACDMYDAIAALQGMILPAAVPAQMPTLEEVVNVLGRALETAPSTAPAEVGKLVKKSATRTMRKNAARDGAKMALIASGDGCPYCKMIASRGWEDARSDEAFEAHLHGHCRCEYAVRFNERLGVEGYDPKGIKKEFEDTGASGWKDRIKLIRRQYREDNRDKINAQKRAAYARKKETDN